MTNTLLEDLLTLYKRYNTTKEDYIEYIRAYSKVKQCIKLQDMVEVAIIICDRDGEEFTSLILRGILEMSEK